MEHNIVKAEIITIGDEILYGQITDTNSQWIGLELANIGILVVHKKSVGDNKKAILEGLSEAERRADLILLTGGLGPTKDDITKNALAEYFGVGMKFHEEILEHIRELFRQRNREHLLEFNRTQAYLPENAIPISNHLGTAPGMWFEKGNKVFISMPGVPHEMKKMMTDAVLPKIIEKFRPPVIYHHFIRTIGIAESQLSAQIAEWESQLPSHIKLAYLPRLGQVKLRLTATGSDKSTLQRECEILTEKLLPLIQDYVFAIGEKEIQEVIGEMLKSRGQMVAIAESCTGGYVSHLFTQNPGSSAYFKGSVVAYHNEVKQHLLGVRAETLSAYGAVSEETAREMAVGVAQKLSADFGISITGIAGPEGGTPEKPVGTVWIACVGPSGEIKTQKLTLSKDRMMNIQLSANGVLNLLRQVILSEQNKKTLSF
ncbi:MAG: competence/damage-inducible protein A [Cytophagales bacterium]|nr:competence/damage-inducible protein A [Cytophagales bacterium]MDW8385164.1 competence/damage-inducible protein A [Flammeovirgaceae bacterium]